MPLETYNNVTFTGVFRHGVDAKNRLTIPADWRSGEEGVLYVRLHTSGTHGIVLSPAQLDKKVAMIEQRQELTQSKRLELIRQFASGSHRCCVDKQGRMVLPPECCKDAVVQGEVVVIGLSDQFEIWGAAHWNALEAAEAQQDIDWEEELGI